MTTEEKVGKLISKLSLKNCKQNGKTIFGYDGIFPIVGKKNKNPIFLDAQDSVVISNACGLSCIMPTDLLRLTKRQHKFLENAFTEILDKHKNESEQYKPYEMKEQKPLIQENVEEKLNIKNEKTTTSQTSCCIKDL